MEKKRCHETPHYAHREHRTEIHGQTGPAQMFVGPYDDLIKSVTTVSGFAELMHFYSISTAMDVALESYYPPITNVGCSPYTGLYTAVMFATPRHRLI